MRTPRALEDPALKFIHLTDTHLVPGGERLHGLNPRDRLEACIDNINTEHADAERCVVTGDLADAGAPDAYRVLRESLARLRMPVHLVIGNHDRREEVLKAFPDTPVDAYGFVQGAVETSVGWFVLLDTVEQGHAWGSYCTKRLDWLRWTLTGVRRRPVYVFMHHPPFDVGIPCLDRLGLGDEGARIGDVLLAHNTVRHLFFGHVHRPVTGSWRGIPYSTLRGTNHQVPLDFEALEVVPKSHEPPAYAVVLLEPDQTTVHMHDYLDTRRVPWSQTSEGRPGWR